GGAWTFTAASIRRADTRDNHSRAGGLVAARLAADVGIEPVAAQPALALGVQRLQVGPSDDHLVHDEQHLGGFAGLELGRLALVAEAARARHQERPERQRVALLQDAPQLPHVAAPGAGAATTALAAAARRATAAARAGPAA